jgi:molybdate transport system regulatory protein
MLQMTTPNRTCPIEPRAKLFLSSASLEGVFGNGKMKLLAAVAETGSISKAASLLGRSYRKAWGDIRRAEEGLGIPLVTTRRGGVSGGCAELTPECLRLLDAWKEYAREMETTMKKAFCRTLKQFFLKFAIYSHEKRIVP